MSYFTKHETLTLKNVLDGEGNVPLRFKRDAVITGKFAEKYNSFKDSTTWSQFKKSGGTFADATKCIKNGNLQIDFTRWEDCRRMIFEAATRVKEADIRNAMQKVYELLSSSQIKGLQKEVEHMITEERRLKQPPIQFPYWDGNRDKMIKNEKERLSAY